MRKTTRSKYNGRTEVAQSLSSTHLELGKNIKALEYHKVGGKRLQAKFRKVQAEIMALHQVVVALPVTPDEKIIAKVKRKKNSPGKA